MVRTRITLILALCALFFITASDLDAQTWRVRIQIDDASQMSLLPRDPPDHPALEMDPLM